MASEFGITAEFPLGVYRATKGGSADPYPDTARLYSALVQAACIGSSAEVDGEHLKPAGPTLAALCWLEAHPPVGITHPDTQPLRRQHIEGFFVEGTLTKEGRSPAPRDKKSQRQLTPGQAVSGKFGWTWQDVPADVQHVLSTLCEDVPSLGEAESPVILRSEVLPPTLRRAARTRGFNSGSRGPVIRVRSAQPGRFDALESAHSSTRPKKRPSSAQDRHTTSESTLRAPLTDQSTNEVAYEPLSAPLAQAPWESAFVLNAHVSIEPVDTLTWSVALHQALAKVSDELPPVITGRRDGGPALPNRVAIQAFQPAGLPVKGTFQSVQLLLVMVPTGMQAEDLDTLHTALSEVRTLTASGHSPIPISFDGELVSASDFWTPAEPDSSRFWVTSPAMVPDTRTQRALQGWGLDQAAKLSIGFVFRDQLGPFAGRGAQRYQQIVEAVDGSGVRVHHARAITRDTGRYVHRLPEGVVAQPYRAIIDGGDLLAETALVAAGQTRHLGGGMLLPLDLSPQQAAGLGLL